MKKKSLSIKWKIFAYLLGFCLLLLLVLALFQTVFLGRFYTAIKSAQVSRAASELAALYEVGDAEAVQANVSERGDLTAELISADGTVVSAGGPFPERGGGSLHGGEIDALWKETRANGGSYTVRYTQDSQPGFFPPAEDGAFSGKTGAQPDAPRGFSQGRSPIGGPPEFLLCAKLVTMPDGSESLLLVRAELTPVNATVDALMAQLVWVSAIMLAVSIVVALLLSRRVSRPIERLNRSATRLAEGDYGAPFDAGGYREVEELSSTLSHTSQELGKTEGLRRELIANVSHDLRTPLTLITGYAEMMRDIPGEDTPENMQVIIDEARRLTSLVADLLDLSQLQSGTGEMHLERVNLTEEVAAIIARFAKFSGPEGFSVAFEHDADAFVTADGARLSQVVYNFLTNALAHGGSGKTITVRQTVQDGRVRLAVADHGAGIPEDQLPYIWDRYYKVDEPHVRASSGSGLGLSIVKSILQQQPGVQYGAESTPGQGSTFWFSLPLAGPLNSENPQ